MNTNRAMTAERATSRNAARGADDAIGQPPEQHRGATVTAPAPDFDTRHAHASGTLPALDKLTTDTALLRRIAYNTDVTRKIMIGLMAVVTVGFLAGLIIGIVILNQAPALVP